MKTYDSILDTIGHTPIVRLKNIELTCQLHARLYAKIEAFNPGGSIKDRIALSMVLDAEKKGQLLPGHTIIEPTSGNTGIGLAMIAAARGYPIILVMPDTASIERRKILAAFGAKLILTDGAKGINEAIVVAKKIHKSTPNSFMPMQFKNPANPRIHYQTTAREIFRAMGEDIAVFVSGIGTGGTISGVGKYLRKKIPLIYLVGLEPDKSPILSQGWKGSHKIQGIGAGFIPKTLNTHIYDEILTISNEAAFERAQMLAKHEGILAGISSGAALDGAIKIAQRASFDAKNILMILPDTGERYLSTDFVTSVS